MTDQDYCTYLAEVKAIAQGASERILDIYERDFEVTNKEDGSPLTEADKAANTFITERLASLTPEIPILSEESAKVEYEERKTWPRFWLVDPLDGTKEFVKRNGEFTVNIALIDNREPVLGVVHVPVTGVSYCACRGKGAFRSDHDGPEKEIKVRDYSGGEATIVASRSHASDNLLRLFSAIEAAQGKPETISMGSSLKFCLVADGSADIYPRLGPTSEWDTGAAQAVVEAAGGKVLTLDGKPLTYNKSSILNPYFVVIGGGSFDWIAEIFSTDGFPEVR